MTSPRRAEHRRITPILHNKIFQKDPIGDKTGWKFTIGPPAGGA